MNFVTIDFLINSVVFSKRQFWYSDAASSYDLFAKPTDGKSLSMHFFFKFTSIGLKFIYHKRSNAIL